MNSWKRLIIVSALTLLAGCLAWLGVRKMADRSIIYVFTDPKVVDWSRFGLKDVGHKRQHAGTLFGLFPSLLCPAADHYIHDEKNMGELRVVVLSGVRVFPEMGAQKAQVMRMLVSWLKNDDGFDVFAAQDLGAYGKAATPALIEAWNRKGSLGFTCQVADSMVRVGDPSFIPVLQESFEKDKSFNPVLSKEDKEESGKALYACIALYEITREDRYKIYLEKVLHRGAKSSKLLTIMSMGSTEVFPLGFSAKETMIHFLQMALKDRDPLVRKFAKEHLEMIEKDLKKQAAKAGT